MVASVAHEATQAPQNSRREMGVVVSDMSSVISRENHPQLGNMGATCEILGFSAKAWSSDDGRLQLRLPTEISVRANRLDGSISARRIRAVRRERNRPF